MQREKKRGWFNELLIKGVNLKPKWSCRLFQIICVDELVCAVLKFVLISWKMNERIVEKEIYFGK